MRKSCEGRFYLLAKRKYENCVLQKTHSKTKTLCLLAIHSHSTIFFSYRTLNRKIRRMMEELTVNVTMSHLSHTLG